MLWMVTQLDEVRGFPLMGDISGENDGSIATGMIVLGLNLVAALMALVAGRRALVWPLAYSGVGILFWAGYSAHHLGRWLAEGGGNLLLLIPEAMLIACITSAIVLAVAMTKSHERQGVLPH